MKNIKGITIFEIFILIVVLIVLALILILIINPEFLKAEEDEEYFATGFLISSTFDTRVAKGVAYNAIMWRGDLPAGTKVELKLAASDTSYGPWNEADFYGSIQGCWDDDLDSNEPMEIKGVCRTEFNNKRFFRYKVILYSDDLRLSTPTVKQVIINYSP